MENINITNEIIQQKLYDEIVKNKLEDIILDEYCYDEFKESFEDEKDFINYFISQEVEDSNICEKIKNLDFNKLLSVQFKYSPIPEIHKDYPSDIIDFYNSIESELLNIADFGHNEDQDDIKYILPNKVAFLCEEVEYAALCDSVDFYKGLETYIDEDLNMYLVQIINYTIGEFTFIKRKLLKKDYFTFYWFAENDCLPCLYDY